MPLEVAFPFTDIGWIQGRNSGMKAVFGGSEKKPLTTKVSMRHLNEIIRERNQYSRDAAEAWQDFINLKTRMDTEVNKVSKRNNFLVEELESWKQQFLKFQAFAEQLTTETQDLKAKIDGHKRENRRLATLIEQHKDDASRLSSRLGGTEKQRDDALEALVLQQEIAEELERERKRNKKDLSALEQTNSSLLRQRDEAQRVVLHLRALIDGQAHHMEHIVRTLTESAQIPEEQQVASDVALPPSPSPRSVVGRRESRTPSRTSTRMSLRGDDEANQDMESRLLGNANTRRRLSALGLNDVADRSLRDKTDAIAYIIRNISEQCAAAVEGLHLARSAESVSSAGGEDDNRRSLSNRSSRHGKKAIRGSVSEDGSTAAGSDYGDAASDISGSYLAPSRGRTSSIPPTPDLVHSVNRSSTSMSVGSFSTTATPDRHSMQSQWRAHHGEDIPEVPTKIVRDDDGTVSEVADYASEEPTTKYATRGLERTRNAMMGMSA